MELLRWAESEGLAVEVVGSGSNLLVADDGVRGLVMKLAGELTAIERDGERIVCGGGARLPSAAAKAARWGLAGLEFGINIPGTVGGAVRMNANAYGGQLARVLEWVDVCTRGGHRAPRRRTSSASPTAARTCAPARWSSRASFGLDGGRAGGGQGDRSPRCGRCAARRSPPGSRPSARPSRTPTHDPRAEGRTAGQLLEAAGLRGLAGRRRPLHPEARQLRREHGRRRRPPTCSRLMAAGRRRVHERFGVELEPEVQVLGDV